MIWFRISVWFQRSYRKFNMTLLDWATAFFSKGLGKFAISVYVEKYLNIAILYRIFPLVSEKTSQIQSDPCPLVYSDFKNGLGKYAISVNVEKYLKIYLLILDPSVRQSLKFAVYSELSPGSGLVFIQTNSCRDNYRWACFHKNTLFRLIYLIFDGRSEQYGYEETSSLKLKFFA